MKRNGNSDIKAGIIAIIFGAALFGLSEAAASAWTKYAAEGVPVKGTVVDIITVRQNGGMRHDKGNKAKAAVVRYVVDGAEYEVTVAKQPDMVKGKETTLYYMSFDPSDANSGPPRDGITVIKIVGAVAALVGVGGIYSGVKDKKALKLLKENGAELTFDNWETESDRHGNGNEYQRAVFRYSDPGGETLEFKSEEYPPKKFPFREGKTYSVYVDVDKPEDYYIDV